MPSADLEAAIKTGVTARTLNTGQSCIAAKRFIISDRIYDRFVPDFVERMRALKIGDPLEPATELGPLTSEAILRGVDKQVQTLIAAGARLLTGGRRAERAGFFYEPTVLADIPHDSPAAREEIFGPVASFFRAADAAEAIKIANDSPFGLGASAWTNDPAEQQLFATELEAGMVFVNSMVASDSRLPFGGVKRSGIGRELGAEGIREFMNIKAVSIA
jgi:succinate-semialdehyde dehydrogenase/glutarate-semialdehyde dehydrogenase